MFFFSLFIFRGHSTREPASSRVTYFIQWPTQEPVLATANTGKNRERFWKKCRWMDRKGRNKQGKNPLATSVTCMAMYCSTYIYTGFKEKTFKFCVLNRWDFNFCVRSSPLRSCRKDFSCDLQHAATMQLSIKKGKYICGITLPYIHVVIKLALT